MKLILVWLGILLACFVGTSAMATHIRAGEITGTSNPTNPFSWTFTLTIYTDSTSLVDDPTLTLNFGFPGTDGTQTRPRTSRTAIRGKATWRNIYSFNVIFPAPGEYTISHNGVNRNSSITNIGVGLPINSDQMSFYIETKITIAPGTILFNSSPILYNAPVDLGATGRIYKHNPAAFDPDGDSLSYELITPRQQASGGSPVPVDGYVNAAIRAGGRNFNNTGPATITIGADSGTLVWNVPNLIGEYNVAILITEWRRIVDPILGLDTILPIGSVVRDMQIIVVRGQNNPPALRLPNDTCLTAGQQIQTRIFCTDIDGDRVNMTSEGGVYNLTQPANRAIFVGVINSQTPVSQVYTWRPNCFNVRRQPYDMVFKAEDIPRTSPALVDFGVWSITVYAPPPTGLRASISNGGIKVEWRNYRRSICPNVDSIFLYRRVDSLLVRDSCTGGIGEQNFIKIAALAGSDSVFIDSDPSTGPRPGIRYFYTVVAQFPNPAGGLSRPANLVGAELAPLTPLLENVSILQTSATDGRVFIRWFQPKGLNPAIYPGPYQYRLGRRALGSGTGFTRLATFNSLIDTVYNDQNLNTQMNAYEYQLSLYYNGGNTLLDSNTLAASPRLTAKGNLQDIELSWTAQVPWSNEGRYHYIYRRVNGVFTLLDSVLVLGAVGTYKDRGSFQGIALNKDSSYRYNITTQGGYGSALFRKLIVNNSQIARAALRDEVPPCAPEASTIELASITCGTCEELQNRTLENVLRWRAVPGSCAPDLDYYTIRYSPYRGAPFTEVGQTRDTTFRHSNSGSLAGLYRVQTVDVSGNVSAVSKTIEIDNCVAVSLPNTFTPGRPGNNAIFRPICIIPAFVASANIQVYNRWGVLVFTNDRGLDWAGRSGRISGDSELFNGNDVSAGTYYYVAEIATKALEEPTKTQHFTGWIEVIR